MHNFILCQQGHGSHGNGAAMRVAPVSLFCHNRMHSDVIEMARQSAEVTHAHKYGVDGSILQALAVHNAITSGNENGDFDVQAFVRTLEEQLKPVEADEFEDVHPYEAKLKQISRLLKIDPSDETVVNVLGNDSSALQSVPTAIYCFLRSFKEIRGIKVRKL